MNKGEPLSSGGSKSPLLIGRGSRGEWVVRDQSGLRGGLFVNRTEALKYAMFENGRRPEAVIMVPETLELDLTTDTTSSSGISSRAGIIPRRQAA
jgi:hypothetical protein